MSRKLLAGLLFVAVFFELALAGVFLAGLWGTDGIWLLAIPLLLAVHNTATAFCLLMRLKVGYELLALMLAPIGLKAMPLGVMMREFREMMEEGEDRKA